MLKIFEKFLHFWGKQSLTVIFLKLCFKSFHRIFIVFKFRADGKLVKLCVAYLTKKNKILPGSLVVGTVQIAAKICRLQPPTMYSECSRF